MRRWRPRSRWAVLALPVLLAACSVAGAETAGGSRGPGVAQATIAVRPDGATGWHPDRPVIVSAQEGTLTKISVTDGKGHAVRGRLMAGHTIWRSTVPMLAFDTRYRVHAVAVDAAGLQTKVRSSFRTVRPEHLVDVGIMPSDGAVVGVGMPVIVTFDEPVPDRATAERRLVVQTTPRVTGGWYWVSDQQVRWRPRSYWAPGTTVEVTADLTGVDLGQGAWGDDTDTAHFTVGDAVVSTVDIADHTLKVRRNGELLRTIPVTTGKPGWDTRNGVKVIISKERTRVMDAASIEVPANSPEYYRLKVEYALRVTWSGEFLHAAPWSVADQGHDNVSHGCTGMSLENAAWFYDLSTPGDVVEYVNGTRELEPWNGYTDWNIAWSDWKAGSALS